MSNLDQCPSSKKNGQPAAKARPAPDVSGATGARFWRSLDDLADTPEFRERLEREFPALASEASEETRRDFIKLMAAGLALAGVVAIPGCRRPDHKILTYAREPEDLVPGNPLYYATAMPMPGGGAQGLLARTIDGRPVKVEGNPLHPINQGRSDSIAQASVLDLYDADRSTHIRRDGAEAPGGWRGFEDFCRSHFPKFDASRGAGLFFLVEKATSPSRDAMRDRVKARWPQAQWLAYEPIDNESAIEGSHVAFGSPLRQRLTLARAKRVASVDRDFLMEPGAIAEARGFAAGRKVHTAPGHSAEAEMNRLYVIETMMSLTGGAADHRIAAKPSETTRLALALAGAVMRRLGGGVSVPAADAGAHQAWIDAAADDLVEHRGAAVLLAGASQPAGVHALFHAVNEALGAVGPIVSFVPMGEDEAQSSLASIQTLARAMESGSVDTLVVIGANPVYDAPADLDFAAKFARVPTTVHLGSHVDETGVAAKWHVNRAHYLESWGDVEALDGGISVIQPMIAPIFDGKTDVELLGAVVADDAHDGYEIVRRTWRDRLGVSAAEFDKVWRRTLHDGRLAGSAPAPSRPSVRGGAVASAASQAGSLGGDGMEAVFLPAPYVLDGRWANNGWLQETPHPVTKITWDNPALLSPATAERLRVRNGDSISVEVGGRGLDIQAWVQPGLADDVVALTLGYARKATGRVGSGVGFDTYAVRSTGAMRTAGGVQAARKA
ncbi:MAG: TAT-variant-translocated molybdopterin oxidoreductase, partial [Phycisphaerales bacterium]|nr:TAT-variant-translocated molybdopterin oxidoreductase [Phycisphaerales bacterium]